MIAATIVSMPCGLHGPTGAHHRVTIRRLAALALCLLLLVIAGRARAGCNTLDYHTGSVSFPSATVTLPNNLYAGLVLWTSPPTAVVNPLQGTCSGRTNNGLQSQLQGTLNSSDDTLFATNVAGLSYRILFSGNNGFTSAPGGIRKYPNQPSDTGNISFSGNAQLQLVVTDPVAFGNSNSNFAGGPIATWNVDGCFWFFLCGTGDAVDFNASTVTFVAPACTVAVDPTVVTLPTVYNSVFTGVGSTGGETPFNVQLNCPSATAGASISITLATNNPAAGITGVIAPTPGIGMAKNVGVQVLGKDGNPISFGTAIPAGTVTAGNFNIQLNARYYQTGGSVSAGNVNATATYTITYQ